MKNIKNQYIYFKLEYDYDLLKKNQKNEEKIRLHILLWANERRGQLLTNKLCFVI